MESMHLAKAIERIDSLWILQRDLGTIAAVYVVAAYSSSIHNDVIGKPSETLFRSWIGNFGFIVVLSRSEYL